MKQLFAIMSFVALPFSAQAQTPWTLQQCIDYAVDHNIQVKQQAIVCQQSEIDVENARSQRLPDLSASASENFSFGRGLTAENTYTNTNTNSTSFSLGTSVPLFTGFRIPRTLELNRLNLHTAAVLFIGGSINLSVLCPSARNDPGASHICGSRIFQVGIKQINS